MKIIVRKEQAELLLRLRADVDAAQGAALQAQDRLNSACAGVLAGIVPDQSAVSEVRVEGDRGVITTEDHAPAA